MSRRQPRHPSYLDYFHKDSQGQSYGTDPRPALGIAFLGFKDAITNIEHPYGTLCLHNVLLSFLVVISTKNSLRQVYVGPLNKRIKEQNLVQGLDQQQGEGQLSPEV